METHPALIRVALLGADESTPPLVSALTASSRFELVAHCEVDPHDGTFDDATAAALAQVRRLEIWEALLDTQQCDAVIVARAADEDRRAEQLRKLIQAEMPVLVSHPVAESMLVYYELDMIRRETHCPVAPVLPERRHPAVRALAQIVAQGEAAPIGKVEQVVIERSIAAAERNLVLRQFARDVDLLRSIAGDMTRLGAMAGGAGEAAYASLGVQMTGPSGVATRWSVAPGDARGGARIALVGTRGKAQVTVAGSAPTHIEMLLDGRTQTLPCGQWNAAEAALAILSEALAGPSQPDWVDAARSIELTETISRSLAKGRTIELHFEEYTEQGAFKGTMASLGCGLLVLGTLLLGAVAIGEQAGVPYTRYWPYFLLAALAFFLLLQMLMLAFRKSAAGNVRIAGASSDAATLPPRRR